jgi:hypothetical protein
MVPDHRALRHQPRFKLLERRVGARKRCGSSAASRRPATSGPGDLRAEPWPRELSPALGFLRLLRFLPLCHASPPRRHRRHRRGRHHGTGGRGRGIRRRGRHLSTRRPAASSGLPAHRRSTGHRRSTTHRRSPGNRRSRRGGNRFQLQHGRCWGAHRRRRRRHGRSSFLRDRDDRENHTERGDDDEILIFHECLRIG